MKYVLKVLCVVLALSMLLCVPVAAEASSARGSDYFVLTRTFLDQTGSNSFDIWFEVTAKRTMQELGVESIVLKRSSDGNNWTSVRTWLPSVNPHMIRTNTVFHSAPTSYTAATGFYYKAYVTYYAKDSTGRAYYDTWTDILYLPSN